MKMSMKLPSQGDMQDEIDRRLSLAISKPQGEAKHNLRMNDLRVASAECIEKIGKLSQEITRNEWYVKSWKEINDCKISEMNDENIINLIKSDFLPPQESEIFLEGELQVEIEKFEIIESIVEDLLKNIEIKENEEPAAARIITNKRKRKIDPPTEERLPLKKEKLITPPPRKEKQQ